MSDEIEDQIAWLEARARRENGEVYRTEHGSTVRVSGKHRGIISIEFDWFEEDACPDAHPTADVSDPHDPVLSWECDCCGYGEARLIPLRAETDGGQHG